MTQEIKLTTDQMRLMSLFQNITKQQLETVLKMKNRIESSL